MGCPIYFGKIFRSARRPFAREHEDLALIHVLSMHIIAKQCAMYFRVAYGAECERI